MVVEYAARQNRSKNKVSYGSYSAERREEEIDYNPFGWLLITTEAQICDVRHRCSFVANLWSNGDFRRGNKQRPGEPRTGYIPCRSGSRRPPANDSLTYLLPSEALIAAIFPQFFPDQPKDPYEAATFTRAFAHAGPPNGQRNDSVRKHGSLVHDQHSFKNWCLSSGGEHSWYPRGV
jgi:hypothetical protein